MPVRPQLLVQQLAAFSESNLHNNVAKVQECVVPDLITHELSAALQVAHEIGHP